MSYTLSNVKCVQVIELFKKSKIPCKLPKGLPKSVMFYF